MRKISISEFKNYFDKLSPKYIILSSENQKWQSIINTFRMDLVFDSLIISFNPNVISLISKNGSVSFERVKHIVENEQSLIGGVFGVVCVDLCDNSKEITYTIIIS